MTIGVGPRPAVHPGEVLLGEFMEPLSLTPKDLAAACRVAPTRIEGLIRREEAMTADLALRLARYFGVSPQFWMNLQSNHDLALAANEAELTLIFPRDAA